MKRTRHHESPSYARFGILGVDMFVSYYSSLAVHFLLLTNNVLFSFP